MGLSRIIIKCTPKILVPRLRSFAREILRANGRENDFPVIDLESKHVAAAELLADRKALLERLPKQSICAEIGVYKGDFSSEILRICKPSKLWLIDYWQDENMHVEILSRFANEIKQGIVEVIRCDSEEAAAQFSERYFDWIYLDTDHSYETTKKELRAYGGKLKNDGVLAGHDFILGNWDAQLRYGVQEAVIEFCKKYDWGIRYLTQEKSIHPSFAITALEPLSVK